MANITVHCDIVSAEEAIFSGVAEVVVAEGISGSIGVMAGHEPLLTKLKPGPIKVRTLHNKEHVFYVEGGFLEVQPDSITVLADTALRAEDIDEKAAREAKERAEKAIAVHMQDKEFVELQIQLARALGQLRTVREANK